MLKRFTTIVFCLHFSPLFANYNYNNTPASTVNPPETIAQDPNVPISPDIYGRAIPLNKTPPEGTFILPASPPTNTNTDFLPVNPATSTSH